MWKLYLLTFIQTTTIGNIFQSAYNIIIVQFIILLHTHKISSHTLNILIVAYSISQSNKCWWSLKQHRQQTMYHLLLDLFPFLTPGLNFMTAGIMASRNMTNVGHFSLTWSNVELQEKSFMRWTVISPCKELIMSSSFAFFFVTECISVRMTFLATSSNAFFADHCCL